jgi:hypothetical protein
MDMPFDREAIDLLIQAMQNYAPFNDGDEGVKTTINRVGLQIEAYATDRGWLDLATASSRVRRLTLDLCHDMSDHDWRDYEVARKDNDGILHRTIRCKKCGENRSHLNETMRQIDIFELPVWGEKDLSALKDRKVSKERGKTRQPAR